jgi:hypothetical protein
MCFMAGGWQVSESKYMSKPSVINHIKVLGVICQPVIDDQRSLASIFKS